MSIIGPYLDKLKSIEKDLPKIAEKSLKDNYSEVVMLVKSEQLGKGLNSFGQPLAWKGGDGFYAESTQMWADAYNVRVPKTEGTPYNFSWSGETLDNTQMKINLNEQNFDIFTIASKQRYLEGIYGEIFKLTKEHNDYVNNQIIIPALYRHILDNFWRV